MSRVRIVPDAPTSVPATISSWLFSVKPAIADGETGVRVEQRDHDGHVRAADRHDERDAEDERQERDDGDQEHRLDRRRSGDRAAEQHERQAQSPPRAAGHELLAGVA